MPNKRNDIQGLRGLAVGLVIWSHLPVGLKMSGGFVGVDIFFVISGFVITRMLLLQKYEITTRRRTYWRFMVSRFSRLLPPLSGLITGTLLLSILFAPTSMLRQISESALHSQGFLSNFFFLKNFDSYWNPNILRNPFLHTWSLGIEFQVYLLLPLLLLGVIRKAPSNRKAITTMIGVSTVGLFSLGTFSYLQLSSKTSIHGYVPSSAAFYLPIARFWEFGLGVVAALYVMTRPLKKVRYQNIIETTALIAIVGGIFMSNNIGELNMFVIPVSGGTALLLGIGEYSKNYYGRRFLTMTPLTWLGDRSYSIYLWHWPMLATASWLYPGDQIPALAFLAVGFMIASLSFHLLERNRSRRPWALVTRQTVPLVLSGILIALSLSIASSTWYRQPQPLASIAMPFPESSKTVSEIMAATSSACSFGDYEIHCKNFPGVTKEVVIIGDSLSFRSFPAVQLSAREHGWNASMFWNGGCSIEIDSCKNSLIGNLVYDYLAGSDTVALLVATNFDRESNRINAVERDLALKPLCDDSRSTKDCQLHRDKIKIFETKARAGLAQLGTYSEHLLVALPFPQQAQIPPTCMSSPIYARIFHVSLSGESCGRTSVKWQEERQGFYPETITKVSQEQSNVELWNPIEYLCFKGWCPAIINDGEQLMSDGIHWDMPGARFLYPAIDKFLDNVAQKLGQHE